MIFSYVFYDEANIKYPCVLKLIEALNNFIISFFFFFVYTIGFRMKDFSNK